MTDTIPGALRAAAERFGDHAAYVTGETTLTYARLLDRVRALAFRYLEHRLQPGDRVVLWGPNSLNWAVSALAVTYAGGVVVPANSRYTAHEVADLVERTSARIVLVADGFLGRTQLADLRAASDLPSVGSLGNLDELTLDHRGEERALRSDVTTEEVEARADAVTPDDVADILFTSGTTGRSKGAMSAHRQTIGVARAWADLGGVRAEDRYLVVNPFFHSFGYKIGIVVGLLTGATLYPGRDLRRGRDDGADRVRADHPPPGRAHDLPVAAQRPEPRRLRPLLAAARGHRSGRRTGGADRADA